MPIWAFPAVFLLVGLAVAQNSAGAEHERTTPGSFVDVTSAVGVNFQYLASHTSKKYLPETMGAGVGLFDYDNDGRLDIFFLNGAPISDPAPPSSIPRKTGPKYWDRLYHQKADGS